MPTLARVSASNVSQLLLECNELKRRNDDESKSAEIVGKSAHDLDVRRSGATCSHHSEHAEQGKNDKHDRKERQDPEEIAVGRKRRRTWKTQRPYRMLSSNFVSAAQ